MKKVIAILLTLVLVFSMAACGGGGNDYDEGPIKIGWAHRQVTRLYSAPANQTLLKC